MSIFSGLVTHLNGSRPERYRASLVARGKESACQCRRHVRGDAGSIPGWGRSPGGGYGNPSQYFCLENPKDRGAWQVTIHGVAEPDLSETTALTHTNVGDPVRSLVWEDPTCLGAAIEPVLWSLGATTTEAMSPRAHAPQQEAPPRCAACAPQLEINSCSLQPGKSRRSNKDPAQAKINYNNNKNLRLAIKKREREMGKIETQSILSCTSHLSSW